MRSRFICSTPPGALRASCASIKTCSGAYPRKSWRPPSIAPRNPCPASGSGPLERVSLSAFSEHHAPPRSDERPEQQQQGQTGQTAHQPVRKEHQHIALRALYRVAEIFLGPIAQNECQHHRGERIAERFESVADHV